MTRARSLSRLANSQAFTVDGDLDVGINSTSPSSKLDVGGDIIASGVVTATSFVGDVTGNADTATYATTAGIATVAENLTGNPSISVTDITATNVDSVGIITAQSGIDVTGGDINVGTATTITDGGINVTGVVTATSFTGNVTGNATGLTGNPTISVTDITATGNVSIGGTLTYEDVTNVDSIGIITAQSGIDVTGGDINVGTATTITDGGINVVGVVTATSFSGDGSNLSGVESGVANFVASGSISNGDAVVVNTDGTVSVVSGVGSLSPNAGTPVVFESANAIYNSIVYDSANQKVVIAYTDNGNSNYGTAVVGTVSGTSISFGTPVVFENDYASDISAIYDSTNQKVVIAYTDVGNFNYGTAIVGTVSGNTISFGSPTVFETGNTQEISATYDSTNSKVVIAYYNSSTVQGKAVVGGVSGTSIGFGTPVVFDGSVGSISPTYDSSNQKVVIAYNANNGTAIVGTVSGTSISFGTPVVFNSGSTSAISAIYDSATNKVIIIYSTYGIIGTVSGTSIDFSLPSAFEASGGVDAAVYDSANNRVVIAYGRGTVIDGVVNVSSVNTLNHNISFGIPTVFETDNTTFTSATYDSTNQKVVVAYQDNGNNNYGTASVITSTNLSSNLSDENYIGIAAEAISDTATGKVNIVGGINSSQTGLTTSQTHYVSPIDGSLSVSPYGEGIPGVPIVVAGTALSSTEIIVKG